MGLASARPNKSMHVNIVIYSIVREIIQESLRWTDLDTVHSKRTEGLAVDIILLSGIDIKIGCGWEAIVIMSLFPYHFFLPSTSII